MKRPSSWLIVVIPVLLILAALVPYRLTAPQLVSGVVRDAETQAPIAGAIVSSGSLTAVANDLGEYSLSLPRGPQTVSAYVDGYDRVERPVEPPDRFPPGVTLDFELAANRVTGIVRDAETKQRLANIAVQIGRTTATTDAQGTVLLRLVRRGTLFAVDAPGYQPVVRAFAGEAELVLDIVPNQVEVTVTNPAGQAIPNTRVHAGDLSVPGDAQGRAVLTRIPVSTVVRASAPGHETASAPFTGTNLQFVLRPNGLEGIVTDAATGKPISNTLVYLGNTIVATNAQGAYRLENVPARASITFKAAGYRKMQIEVGESGRGDVKLTPFLAKGIHLPFGMEPAGIRAAMDLTGKTELNAIVLDVKAEKGPIAWDSQVPLARQINALSPRAISLTEVIERCRTLKIYCIARLPVFQDSRLAKMRPDLALKFPNGTPFVESGDRGWTDPTNPVVWDYNIALAKEVALLGFDEIQFDYVRFPGRAGALYTGASATEEGRVGAIVGFLARAQKELRPTGVFLSADVFGLTVAINDEQYTGQRLKDLGPYLDYVSPMVYPAVWADASILLSKGLGVQNCAVAVRCPYDVIYYSYKRAAEKTTAKVRLWLQAYAGPGNYGVAEYRQQKKAAEDAGSQGWLFWNALGNYDPKMFGPP
jgi:hypothetical protein